MNATIPPDGLVFASSPHIHTPRTVRGAMFHVLLALLPAVACSLYYFGLSALGVLVTAAGAAVATEWVITRYMLRRPATVFDGSALLTGVLLALNLPSSLPLWMVAAGAFFAVGIAKMAFGGLGCNIFNPALVGRVFLLISFPVAMTSWPLPCNVDAASGATFLELVKTKAALPDDFSLADMAMGHMGGSMGEVSAIALFIGFVYLLLARIIKFDIPVAIVVGVAFIDLIAGFPLVYDLLSGGLLLGAIFMATDYVTSPMTRRGAWIYGIMIGIITASIRRWGAYPEGMSFAILIMNGATPLIDRYVRPARFSPGRKEVAA